MKREGLRKTYGQKAVLDVPSLVLTDGAITAIIGANGSGKSTLLRVLAGAEAPDAPLLREPGAPALLGYMPQKSHGFKLSLERNLLLGVKPVPENRQRAEALLNALALSDLRRLRGDRLSGGETQKLALARLLMRHNDLLLLDEPTSAMDAPSTLAAEELLRAYCRRERCTVLLVTHSIRQAQRVSDFLIVLDEGRVAEQGPTRTVLAAPRTEEAKRFLAFAGG